MQADKPTVVSEFDEFASNSNKCMAVSENKVWMPSRTEPQKGYSLTLTKDGTTITATAESMNECILMFTHAFRIKDSTPFVSTHAPTQ